MGLIQFFNTLHRQTTSEAPVTEISAHDIIAYRVSLSNNFIDLYFNDGVYAEAEAAIEATDLRITNFIAGGATAISIASIKKPDHHLSASATAIAAGDTIVRVFLTLTGTPDGTESFQIHPQLNSIFDVGGIPMAGSKSTGTVYLTPSPYELYNAEEVTAVTTTSLGVSTLTDLMGNLNFTQTTDADRPLHYRNRAIQFDSANSEWMLASSNATLQKQQANNFAVFVKDLRPNSNQQAAGGWIFANHHGTNNQGWSWRHGFATNQLNFLMQDGTSANSAGLQNFEDRKLSMFAQNESSVISQYDENNNRVGSQGSTVLSTITYTGVTPRIGRRETQTTNYFNGEWNQLAFYNQALTATQRERILRNQNIVIAGKVGTLTKYAYPLVNGSIVSSDKDTMQVFLGSVIDVAGIRHIFYTGNAADGDVDRIFKATKAGRTPFVSATKALTTGSPTVVIGPSGVNGTWNENEVFARAVLEGVGEYLMFVTGNQIGASPAYTLGLYVSTDLDTWTSEGQVYTDGTTDIISFAGDIVDGVIHGIVCTSASGGGATNNFNYDYITSTDYGRTFTKVGSVNALFNNIILITCIKKYGDWFYIACTRDNRDPEPSSGTQAVLYKTLNFVTSVYLGEVLRKEEPHERSVAIASMILSGGEWEFYYSYLKNQNKTTSNGGEGYSAIRVAVLDTDTIQQATVVNQYPTWVKKYWPLSQNSATGSVFREMIDGDTVTYAGGNWSLALNFYKWVSGAGPVTWPNNGLIFSATDFALKMRVEIITTGTINLFSCGTDIVVQLVSGNLRVALNNATKDYITNADIAKPTGITDPGNHVYVGFIWQGGALKLCVGNTIDIASTKTVDNAMTNIANGGSDVLLFSGATIESGRVVTMSGQTDQQWIDTDL